MTKILCYFFLLLIAWPAGAAFSNYNSVLIGERAAGMGGAYTALTNDASACSFYNPAAVARMDGNSINATINLFNKYDTQWGDLNGYNDAPLKVNRGSIVPVPSASGAVYSFGNFAAALSILYPDFELYNGPISSNGADTSFLNIRDESLWVGGSIALNLTDRDAFGLSMYYTSRTYSRSITDQSTAAAVTTVSSEEKAFFTNDLIYILGYFRELNENWSFGFSARLPSIPVSSQGTFFSSTIDTSGSPVNSINESDLVAQTQVPARLNLGISYVQKRKLSLGLDLHFYDDPDYLDLKGSANADLVRHKGLVNLSLGAEFYPVDWIAFRGGLFTNRSSQKEIPETPTQRQGDTLDMWGFSANMALHTSPQNAFTLGGYYSGGKGYSVQQIGQGLFRIPKSQQIFSFLVGTSYQF